MLEGLTTAHLADACLRLQIAPRCVPLRPVSAGSVLYGRAVPVRHYGSVDIFLEAIDAAAAGDVMVIDNGGRLDEGCVGDMVSLEAMMARLAGIVIWGCHRDTQEIRSMRMPLFSLGAISTGPMRLDPRDELAFKSARVGEYAIDSSDYVVADDDGVVFIASGQVADIAREAEAIRDTERLQAARAYDGLSLRKQLRLSEYLDHRAADPTLTFRHHLESIGAVVEEGFH